MKKSLLIPALAAVMAAQTQRQIKEDRAAKEKAKEEAKKTEPANARDWQEDIRKKKNLTTCNCNRCNEPFKGNRRRRYCFLCEPVVAKNRDTLNARNRRINSMYE